MIEREPMKFNADPHNVETVKAMTKDEAIEFLWSLLDDIDTADDMAKENDEFYRKRVQHLQKRRWETGITTDGYVLDTSALSGGEDRGK